MSIRLVYIGAVAEVAPAASLRALSGGGAVVLPADPADTLAALVREHAPAAETLAPASTAAALCDRAAAGPAELTVCIGGPSGPALARRSSRPPPRAAVAVETVPAGEAFDDALLAQELVSLQAHRDGPARAVPMGPRADAPATSSVHGRGGLRAGRRHRPRGRWARSTASSATCSSRSTSSACCSRRTQRRRPGHRRGPDRGQAHPPPRPHLRRRGGRDPGRRARHLGGHQACAGGPRGYLPRGAGVAAGAAAGAQGPAARRRGRLRLGRRRAGVPQDRRGARRARGGAAGAAGGRRRRRRLTGGRAADREARLRHEVGDLLFAVVNVARKAGVDPELALRDAAARFVARVEGAEAAAAARAGTGRR